MPGWEGFLQITGVYVKLDGSIQSSKKYNHAIVIKFIIKKCKDSGTWWMLGKYNQDIMDNC